MAKFYGPIGYGITREKRKNPGVWEEILIERNYSGDVLRASRQNQPGERVVSDSNVNVRISIVADAYANKNFFAIKYVKWMGASWIVTNIDVERPRLILTIGGLYNGPEARSTHKT